MTMPGLDRPPRRRRISLAVLALVAIALLLGGLHARPARAADEPPGGGGVEAKIKKKMQEILKLMQENERVLLRVSSGLAGTARRVDVDVPPPPAKAGGSSGGASGGTSGGGTAGGTAGGGSKAGGPPGGEAARKMRELIEGQKRAGGKIPGEIGQLLRMIPRRKGKGQGQPQDQEGDGKGDKDGNKEQQARDARKKLGEKNEQKPGGKDPKQGSKSPKDPARRMPNGQPDGNKIEQPKREDNVPAWMAALPPEIRDAMAGGRAEDIPPKYRHLIKAYHLWLQKHRKP